MFSPIANLQCVGWTLLTAVLRAWGPGDLSLPSRLGDRTESVGHICEFQIRRWRQVARELEVFGNYISNRGKPVRATPKHSSFKNVCLTSVPSCMATRPFLISDSLRRRKVSTSPS